MQVAELSARGQMTDHDAAFATDLDPDRPLARREPLAEHRRVYDPGLLTFWLKYHTKIVPAELRIRA